MFVWVGNPCPTRLPGYMFQDIAEMPLELPSAARRQLPTVRLPRPRSQGGTYMAGRIHIVTYPPLEPICSGTSAAISRTPNGVRQLESGLLPIAIQGGKGEILSRHPTTDIRFTGTCSTANLRIPRFGSLALDLVCPVQRQIQEDIDVQLAWRSLAKRNRYPVSDTVVA